MRQTLLLIASDPHAAALQERLGFQYEFLLAEDCRHAASLLTDRSGEAAAILASPVFAEPLLAEEPPISVPVIATDDSFTPEQETRLIAAGAAEILDLSHSIDLQLHRLKTAIAMHSQPPSGTTQVQEGLRLSLERHQIIMSQTNDIIFELDLLTDTLSCSPKWIERFGYPHITDNACSRLLSASHIHPEDIAALSEKLDQFRAGTRYLEAELRISNAAGQYTWNHLRATAQQDQDENAIKLVGVIIDIDQEKRISQALLDEAARDPLTKLYNRTVSRRKIDNYLSSCPAEEQAALLAIDLDNFKDVNDHYGHMYGDAVLVQVATEICRFFRENDVISRIGGDEFIILMKNIPGRTLVEHRCQNLIAAIQNLHQTGSITSPLSCSIGIALIPEHGTTYPDLFQQADRALYSAKTLGKGCFVFHDPGGSTSYPPPIPLIPPVHNTKTTLTDHVNLVRQIFALFFESRDTASTIQTALALTGKHVDASRAYIFENDPLNRVCSNTFEWCSEGIEPQQETLQNISYESDLLHYQDHFNEQGVFYCSDVTSLPSPQKEILMRQNIKSLLQCSIRDEGIFRGFVGFDACTDHRLWTQDQIDLLTLLSQMLSLFLLKNRAQHPLPSEADPQ